MKNGLASPLTKTKIAVSRQKLRLVLSGQMSFTCSEYNPPKPNAFQFVINAPIISAGSKTFTNADEANGDPLAEALFQIYGVENIYLKESFVTITKSETIGWHTVFEKNRRNH